MNSNYDVVIVGAGPAGISAGIDLLSRDSTLEVLIIDEGLGLESRQCPGSRTGRCIECRQCKIAGGIGGASGTLGGKLCFFPAGIGLSSHIGETSRKSNLEVNEFLGRFTSLNLGQDLLDAESSANRTVLKEYLALPILKSRMNALFTNLMQNLIAKGANVMSSTKALDITPGTGGLRFNIAIERGNRTEVVSARHAVVWATGRSGASRTSTILRNTGIPFYDDVVDVGIRIVFPRELDTSITPDLQDPKFKLRPGRPDEVRTLCWTRGGALTTLKVEDQILVDGHFGSSASDYTSVSVVARLPVPEGVSAFDVAKEQFVSGTPLPTGYCQSLREFVGMGAHTGGMPGGRELHGRNTGNLKRMTCYSLREKLVEMIEEIDIFLNRRLLSDSRPTVFAPVIDKMWPTPVLDSTLSTGVPGLYVAGDAAGKARGIIQALRSGIAVGRSIHTDVSLSKGFSLLSEKEYAHK